MKQEIVKTETNYVSDFEDTRKLCQMLLESPHYKKIGPEGIYAIVETAKSLGVDPRQALGGGLYYVKGKVEMSSRMMAALIRSRKHSITRDRKSDETICILHAKRADNGDEWTESFSMAEAQKAGLTRNSVWQTFPRDMLYARALSRLARQLFPDIIGNCYVQGEISLDDNIKDNTGSVKVVEEKISQEQLVELRKLLDKVPDYRDQVNKHMRGQDPSEMSVKAYNKLKTTALSRLQKQLESEETTQEEVTHVSA